MEREKLREALVFETQCSIQHDGWPCGTCFFSIDKSLTNTDWRAVLAFRGDYPSMKMTDDRNKRLEKIYDLLLKKGGLK